MKISDGFDARRLRHRKSGNWGARLVTLIGAMLALCGVLMIAGGVAGLSGYAPGLGEIDSSTGGAIAVAIAGLVTAYIGVRICRRRRRRQSALNMAPHLMKKHD